jgi:hypothetical protein
VIVLLAAVTLRGANPAGTVRLAAGLTIKTDRW